MSGGGGILERYQSLGVGESLLRPYDYPWACKEVGFILRSAYANLPKTLQHLLFQHTLAAFRLLPKVQTQSGMAAVTILLQAAEVAFPKQKRVLAVTEYKHAVVAYKRNCKNQQVEEESVDLPQDILVQIFSLLDMRSFLTAGLVCCSPSIALNHISLTRLLVVMFLLSPNNSDQKIHLQPTIGYRYNFKKENIGKPAELINHKGICCYLGIGIWLLDLIWSRLWKGSRLELAKTSSKVTGVPIGVVFSDFMHGLSRNNYVMLMHYNRYWLMGLPIFFSVIS
ncbi:hypothetical protein Syun_019134 [Stephania yunnanensis]|uniref:F-box domain-containing protein n=1 Tax=Stephania yunnanensis TaxID=152371 RepID=A0AAP0IVI2_9MAGN